MPHSMKMVNLFKWRIIWPQGLYNKSRWKRHDFWQNKVICESVSAAASRGRRYRCVKCYIWITAKVWNQGYTFVGVSSVADSYIHVKTGTQTQRRPQLADQIQCFPIFSKTLLFDVERLFRVKLLHSGDIKSNDERVLWLQSDCGAQTMKPKAKQTRYKIFKPENSSAAFHLCECQRSQMTRHSLIASGRKGNTWIKGTRETLKLCWDEMKMGLIFLTACFVNVT